MKLFSSFADVVLHFSGSFICSINCNVCFLVITLGKTKPNLGQDVKKETPTDASSDHIAVHTFMFRELASATKNFRADCLLGEGGFGRVYKGRLESTNKVSYTF